MSKPAEPLRCPDHGVELVHRPFGETVKALMCPKEPDSFMSTSNRWCSRCGARDASWMSGTCDSCYSIISRQQKESKRQWERNYAVRDGISTAIEAARKADRPEVVAWLTEYEARLQ